jgi:hypothetical protein
MGPDEREGVRWLWYTLASSDVLWVTGMGACVVEHALYSVEELQHRYLRRLQLSQKTQNIAFSE